jgi:16S rRNA processing protein RimM
MGARLPQDDGDWVIAGMVVGLHGVRGEVKVVPTAERPGRLAALGAVTLRLPNGKLQEAQVVSYRPYEGKGVDLIVFEGYEDRTRARDLTNAQLLVKADECPPLPEGEYYDWQIVGLQVVTVGGRELGSVEEVLHTGANDVYVTPAGLLPATGETVKQIDLAAGRIIVDPLPGMLDGSDE